VKKRLGLVVTIAILAAALVVVPIQLSSRPAVNLTDLVLETTLLPSPWNHFPMVVDSVTAPYSYGSVQNASVSWRESQGVWPYFGQWILQFASPLSAAYSFNLSIPLATRSEPGIEEYDPHWKYQSQYGDQARIGCTDLATGVPVRPENCTARIRYGQYVVVITMSQPPIEERSFLNAIALVDEFVGERLRPQ